MEWLIRIGHRREGSAALIDIFSQLLQCVHKIIELLNSEIPRHLACGEKA